MHLGDITNPDAAEFGKPLDGVRILAAEQMQAMPYATQLLARLGADVVKVEHPVEGESGRGALPAMNDPEGRRVGATFLRNNLGKRSVGIDLKSPRGRELFIELAGRFDVVCENFKAGTMDRLGLGYDVLSARHPHIVFASVSGFGSGDSPYRAWPAYAMVPEAMSGIYEYARRGDEPPRVTPVGALGDISSALFAVVGILAALRHRETTGVGQHVDVAMFDAVVAMTDVVTNLWSLGERPSPNPPLIMTAFRAADGFFACQVAREHQFEALARLVGREEWLSDERLATRAGWGEHVDDLIRPAVEEWARDKTRLEACDAIGRANIPAGPCFTAPEVIADPHVASRNMLVEMDRVDGVPTPVLVPGNPVKLSRVSEGPETRVPWVGEHTEEVLNAELGLSSAEIERLRTDGVVN